MQTSAALPAILVALAAAVFVPCGLFAETQSTSSAEDEVRNAEAGFAQSFADRDFERFSNYVADDAVFASGDGSLVGKEAVLARWKTYFDSETPPFSWRPKRVLANPDGTLGATTGPVFLPDGTHAGAFASTWRKGDNGWQVIFDVSPPCPRPEP